MSQLSFVPCEHLGSPRLCLAGMLADTMADATVDGVFQCFKFKDRLYVADSARRLSFTAVDENDASSFTPSTPAIRLLSFGISRWMVYLFVAVVSSVFYIATGEDYFPSTGIVILLLTALRHTVKDIVNSSWRKMTKEETSPPPIQDILDVMEVVVTVAAVPITSFKPESRNVRLAMCALFYVSCFLTTWWATSATHGTASMVDDGESDDS